MTVRVLTLSFPARPEDSIYVLQRPGASWSEWLSPDGEVLARYSTLAEAAVEMAERFVGGEVGIRVRVLNADGSFSHLNAAEAMAVNREIWDRQAA